LITILEFRKRAENVARARELLTLPILPVAAIKATTTNADELRQSITAPAAAAA
jgi:hypothetical protein